VPVKGLSIDNCALVVLVKGLSIDNYALVVPVREPLTDSCSWVMAKALSIGNCA